MIGYNNQGN